MAIPTGQGKSTGADKRRLLTVQKKVAANIEAGIAANAKFNAAQQRRLKRMIALRAELEAAGFAAARAGR